MRTAVRASLFLMASALLTFCSSRSNHFDYSGTLQAESAQVGSTIGGRVISVKAGDGQRVARDQILVILDDSAERAGVATAISQEVQAAAALADLEAGPRPAEVARAQSVEAQAQAQLQKAQIARGDVIAAAAADVNQAAAGLRQAQAANAQAAQNYRRIRLLSSEGAVSNQALDDARSAARQARANVAAARARVTAAQANLVQTSNAVVPQDIAAAQQAYQAARASRILVQQGARPDQIAQAKAVLAAAHASIAAAQSRLREMTIRSPAEGVVEALDLHPGDLVAPGAVVATIQEFRDPYVRIYVTQHDLGTLTIGQSVRVRSDALGGEEFNGKVEQIDQTAQFTPRDVQTPEDRADLTFGVKVRVHDPDRKLHGGTTVEVALR